MTKSDDRLVLLFGIIPELIERKKLDAITARIFQVVADYAGIANTPENQSTLAVRIGKFVSELDELHPVTLRPMWEHWHFKERQEGKPPELLRLLRGIAQIKGVVQQGQIDEVERAEIDRLAHESSLANGTVTHTDNRDKQEDWIGPVIDFANDLHRRRPGISTSGIARLIEPNKTVNPTGKKYDAIRKALNKRKI